MALPIDTFITGLRVDVEKFEAAYRKKAEENPEHYPLEMADGRGLVARVLRAVRGDR